MEDDLCDDGDGALPRQYEFRFHSTGVESLLHTAVWSE